MECYDLSEKELFSDQVKNSTFKNELYNVFAIYSSIILGWYQCWIHITFWNTTWTYKMRFLHLPYTAKVLIVAGFFIFLFFMIPFGSTVHTMQEPPHRSKIILVSVWRQNGIDPSNNLHIQQSWCLLVIPTKYQSERNYNFDTGQVVHRYHLDIKNRYHAST